MVLSALTAGLFTWGVTTLGALTVLTPFPPRGKITAALSGFGGGVMLASLFFSLLLPAIERSGGWLWPALGTLAGGAAVFLFERFFPQADTGLLSALSVTLHNFPEGMAVGVAFAAPGGEAAAVALAIGIGVQNFPEGAAVALPLHARGLSRGRAFLLGSLSGAIEPLGALLGVCAAQLSALTLPFLLAFSAGAMLCVTVGDLLPEAYAQSRGAAALGLLPGFLLMTILDVALG